MHGTKCFMEIRNLMVINCQKKKARITERDIAYCWTCGHHAKLIDNRCACCYKIISKPKKHDRYLEIKEELDLILKNESSPEFRFYISGWVCWINQDDLNEYAKLAEVDKADRYFHFIRSLLESDKLARVIH
jgi:hypothetical protein